MSLTPDLHAEFDLLLHFNPASLQEGLKVHADAAPELIEAAARLHAKGLITQRDGGYLTDLGVEAAEHLRHLLGIVAGD